MAVRATVTSSVAPQIFIQSSWMRLSLGWGASNAETSSSRSGRLLHWIIELAPLAKLVLHYSCHPLLAVNWNLFSNCCAMELAARCKGSKSTKSRSVSRMLRQNLR